MQNDACALRQVILPDNELYDLLQPGCARFGVRRDEQIVRFEGKVPELVQPLLRYERREDDSVHHVVRYLHFSHARSLDWAFLSLIPMTVWERDYIFLCLTTQESNQIQSHVPIPPPHDAAVRRWYLVARPSCSGRRPDQQVPLQRDTILRRQDWTQLRLALACEREGQDDTFCDQRHHHGVGGLGYFSGWKDA